MASIPALVPVPEVKEINWEQPSAEDLKAAIKLMVKRSSGQTVLLNDDGQKIENSAVVTLTRKMFIEYAEDPAAKTGISWTSSQNSENIQRVLKRLRVRVLATDETHAHGYGSKTFTTIKNRK